MDLVVYSDNSISSLAVTAMFPSDDRKGCMRMLAETYYQNAQELQTK